MKKLHGITVAMVTPFTQNGLVDLEAVEKLTEFLIQSGVNCLYPCGTTGEMFHLSIEERKAIAKKVVDTAKGRATVFIHTGAMTTEDTLSLSLHAQSINADGVGVVSPAFFGVNPREMEHYYATIAKTLDKNFPIYLYNIPQCAANDLTVDVVYNLANQYHNIVGLKYSYPDMIRTDEYLHVTKNFSVLQGADKLLLPVLAMGCDGVVSGTASAFPEPFVAVKAAFDKKDFEKAKALQWRATQIVNITKGGSNMGYFKAALAWRGMIDSHMRQPQLDITQQEKQDLYEQLEKWNSEN